MFVFVIKSVKFSEKLQMAPLWQRSHIISYHINAADDVP